MYSSNQPTQASSTPTETRHATTATHQQPPPQYSSSQQQAPPSSSYDTSAAKPQQTRATAQEPYPTQESTWWEEGVSPHPGRAEQGYGPGPSGQRQPNVGPGDNRNMIGAGQDQSGQYGHHDQKRAHDEAGPNWNKIAKIICAVLLPPLGVFLETGCDKSFAINLLLTILGYIPGIIHAIYVIIMD